MQSKENISEMVYLVLVQHTFNLGFLSQLCIITFINTTKLLLIYNTCMDTQNIKID